MELHCYDGPVDPTEKRTIMVKSLGQLRRVVDQLIESGEVRVNLQLNPLLLAEPETCAILERIVTDHPRSKPDVKTSPQAETKAKTEAQVSVDVEEIVTYAASALDEQFYRGFTYQVCEDPEGFRVRVHRGCAGWFEPWDCAFATLADADLHGRAHIDQAIEEIDRS